MKTNIGFTGITGMLGKNFLDYYFDNPNLIDKYNIKGISRGNVDILKNNYKDKFDRIKYSNMDYSNKESIKSAISDLDILIHAAGVTKAKNLAQYESGNVEVTKNLLEEALHSPSIKYFVYISTQAVLGPSEKPLKEDSYLNPISNYGKSKAIAEELVKEKAKKWIIIRLPTIFGKYEYDSLKLFQIASKRIVLNTSWNDFTLSYIIANDAVELLFKLIDILCENKIENEILHFCYDQPIEIKEFMKSIISLDNKNPLINLNIPKFVFNIASVITFFDSLLKEKVQIINSDKIKEFMNAKWLISNEYTKKLLNIDKIEKRAKIEDIYNWYKEQGLI